MPPWRRRTDGRAGETTLFFATDLHGSEVCFRKFVAAAGFYRADLLILGGDLTGKMVVPIVEQADGRFAVEQYGERRVVAAGELEEFEREAADQGLYTERMTAARYEHYAAHPDEVDRAFLRLMRERLERWLDYAKQRLADTGVRILTAPGNDDPEEVDGVIRERGEDRVVLTEGEVVTVAPGHEMLNTGWSNPTPWKTHREYPEPAIRAHVERMAERLENPASAIFNIHVPPYDSGIDTAPQLDDDLAVRTSMGAQLSGPAGSTAVRELIEHYQPLASLHGHIHEAGGSVRIGRTVAVNAGSEYADGVLRGVLLTIADGKLLRHQATTG